MVQMSPEAFLALISSHLIYAGNYEMIDSESPTHSKGYHYTCVYADELTGEVYKVSVKDLNSEEKEISILCANSGMRNQKNKYNYLTKRWFTDASKIIDELVRLLSDANPVLLTPPRLEKKG